MPTVVTYYVNTASTAGGDGTTNNTTGTNRAFASMNDFEAAVQQSMVTNDRQIDVFCSGTAADVTAPTFSGWTGDATRYLQVIGDNTGGKWDSTKYRISTNNATNSLLVSGCYYARFRRIQIEVTRTTGTTQFSLFRISAIAGTNNVDVRVDSCITRVASFGTATGNTFGFDCRIAGSGQRVYYTNNVAYNFNNTNGGTEYGFIAFGTASAARVIWYNNTSNGANGAFNVSSGSASTVIARNNLAASGGFTGSALLTSSHNASTDATATGTGAITNATFTFVDAANGDYHLAAGDTSGAKTGGTNLTSDADYAFSTDIDGTTRPGGSTAWSIGADEYVSAGGTTHALAAVGSAASSGSADLRQIVRSAASGSAASSAIAALTARLRPDASGKGESAGSANLTIAGAPGTTYPLAGSGSANSLGAALIGRVGAMEAIGSSLSEGSGTLVTRSKLQAQAESETLGNAISRLRMAAQAQRTAESEAQIQPSLRMQLNEARQSESRGAAGLSIAGEASGGESPSAAKRSAVVRKASLVKQPKPKIKKKRK